MPLNQIPNLITIFRFVLVIPFVGMLAYAHYGEALLLFGVMGFSDAADGYIAKRFGWQTTLGAYLDPLADKTMLVSAYLTLGWSQLLPFWLVMTVIARDVVILTGAIAYHFAIRHLEIVPTYMSKFNTAVQITLVLVVILNQLWALHPSVMTVFIFIALITTLLSGIDYVVQWSSKTQAALRRELK